MNFLRSEIGAGEEDQLVEFCLSTHTLSLPRTLKSIHGSVNF